jgi:hypothetical protein
MARELTAYLLPHRHSALSHALYGSEHGSGECTPALTMVSGEVNLDLNKAVLCYYENNVPALLTTKVDSAEWDLLCSVVERADSVNVIFDDGERDFLAKLGVSGGAKPRDGGVEVRFQWKEKGEAIVLWEKGIRWVRKKFK